MDDTQFKQKNDYKSQNTEYQEFQQEITEIKREFGEENDPLNEAFDLGHKRKKKSKNIAQETFDKNLKENIKEGGIKENMLNPPEELQKEKQKDAPAGDSYLVWNGVNIIKEGEDSVKMQNVKSALNAYAELSKGKMSSEDERDYLNDIVSACDSYCFMKFSLFKFGEAKKRLSQVKEMRSKAMDRLNQLKTKESQGGEGQEVKKPKVEIETVEVDNITGLDPVSYEKEYGKGLIQSKGLTYEQIIRKQNERSHIGEAKNFFSKVLGFIAIPFFMTYNKNAIFLNNSYKVGRSVRKFFGSKKKEVNPIESMQPISYSQLSDGALMILQGKGSQLFSLRSSSSKGKHIDNSTESGEDYFIGDTEHEADYEIVKDLLEDELVAVKEQIRQTQRKVDDIDDMYMKVSQIDDGHMEEREAKTNKVVSELVGKINSLNMKKNEIIDALNDPDADFEHMVSLLDEKMQKSFGVTPPESEEKKKEER